MFKVQAEGATNLTNPGPICCGNPSPKEGQREAKTIGDPANETWTEKNMMPHDARLGYKTSVSLCGF